MPLSRKPLSQITEADLLMLIAEGAAEGKTIDYKRGRLGQTDGEKKEFLYDLSSFANTAGGHLVFGIEERGGLPVALHGLAGVDPDQEIARIEQIA
jgi:predicted HTH transcriptional regulator